VLKWLLSHVSIRYKLILDNKGTKKSGRGTKKWQYFDEMDDICGQRASSVSLRVDSASASNAVGHGSVAPKSSSRVVTKAVTSTVPSESVERSSLIRPLSDSDEDDVAETGSLRKNGSGGRVVKRKKLEKAPHWFTEAESRMNKAQDEWRQELMRRMDTTEKLQEERISVMRETNSILKQLLQASRNES